MFFSEEKNQKTFSWAVADLSFRAPPPAIPARMQAAQTPEFAKVFCFFSSEKKAFLLPFYRMAPS
jgi:hypothetical protein